MERLYRDGPAAVLPHFQSGFAREKFDPDGTFVKKYLPVLRQVPLQYIHKPWEMPEHVQEKAGCRLGIDYPVPRVDHASRRKLAMSLFQEAKDRYAMTRK